MRTGNWNLQPSGAPPLYQQEREEEHWRHFDNSVNAVSFGFVATAILISMFLIMAIFERFFRPRSTGILSPAGRNNRDLEVHQVGFNGKLAHPSPKASVYARGVSVLMPGEAVPTFIAHPAPVPCPPDRLSWPPSPHNPFNMSRPQTQNSNTNST